MENTKEEIKVNKMEKSELLKRKVALITLGCDKNRVDAEKILYFLTDYGFQITNNILDAEIVIVNTCAFINASRKESLNTIFEINCLRQNKLEKLIVTGCLSEKNYNDLCENLPEADLVLRLKDNKFIVRRIEELYNVNNVYTPCFNNLNRVVSTPKNYAYLKISDGCNNFCSYCTIPFIRGRFKSVNMENLVLEAEELVSGGAREIILVGQDVTKYGFDLYGEYKLVELIQKLSKIEKLKWIRLLYCYPELISDELINEIDTNDKVCKYIDIPLQHISDSVLKNMNRKGDKNKILSVIDKLKKAKNFISIRSTFIVGFPKEKHKDFLEVKQFLIEYKLNNVGFFAYSKEENTKAYYMKGQIPNFVKKYRLKHLQKLQKNVIINNNQKLVGKVLEAVVENFEDGVYTLRSEYNAPEIDTNIFVKTEKQLNLYDYYKIKITEVAGYDLIGEIIDENESSK